MKSDGEGAARGRIDGARADHHAGGRAVGEHGGLHGVHQARVHARVAAVAAGEQGALAGKYLADNFKGKKIGIFYKFKEELTLLKKVFGPGMLTENLQEFYMTDKSIALQIVSGREGISLKEADALVMYNIDFSATSYWQGRDRMTTKERAVNKVYWIFSRGGIEHQIYQTVQGKKNYTLKHYQRNQQKPIAI